VTPAAKDLTVPGARDRVRFRPAHGGGDPRLQPMAVFRYDEPAIPVYEHCV